MGHHRYAKAAVSSGLIEPSIEVSSFDALTLEMNSRNGGDHIGTISPAGVLLAPAGFVPVLPEVGCEFEFTADPLRPAVQVV